MEKQYTLITIEESQVPLAGKINSEYALLTVIFMVVALVVLAAMVYIYLCMRLRGRIKELGGTDTKLGWNIRCLREKIASLENEKVEYLDRGLNFNK